VAKQRFSPGLVGSARASYDDLEVCLENTTRRGLT
jgi:hypothetical protein